MVLTKEELIASLQNEVRILVHLAGKVDKSKVDYRPTPKQRSTLELLQYMSMMGPTAVRDHQSRNIRSRRNLESGGSGGKNDELSNRPWPPSKNNRRSTPVCWADGPTPISAGEVDMFGRKSTRGRYIGKHGAQRIRRLPDSAVLLPQVLRA